MNELPRIASSVATSSRKTRRDAAGTAASSAVFSATVASVVRLSTKKRPAPRRARATTARITRGSAVAAEPMWLFTPTAPGTVARSSSSVRAISRVRLGAQDEARARAAPSGNPAGSIGRWRSTSLPPRASARADAALQRSPRQHGARDRAPRQPAIRVGGRELVAEVVDHDRDPRHAGAGGRARLGEPRRRARGGAAAAGARRRRRSGRRRGARPAAGRGRRAGRSSVQDDGENEREEREEDRRRRDAGGRRRDKAAPSAGR